jgi:transposase-like protein
MEAGKKPRVVITDSLPAYPQAIGDVFGCDTRHIRYKGITKEPNNNILERFHGSLKSRTKVMRGLKSMESAKLFTDGWLVWYNYLRPHESLGNHTPAGYPKEYLLPLVPYFAEPKSNCIFSSMPFLVYHILE